MFCHSTSHYLLPLYVRAFQQFVCTVSTGAKFHHIFVEWWHFFSLEEPFVKYYKSRDKNRTDLRRDGLIVIFDTLCSTSVCLASFISAALAIKTFVLCFKI